MKTILKSFIWVYILLSIGCTPNEKKAITIFYTVDEHGWINDAEKGDGAAALMHLWKEKENYSLDADSFLILSGGDMWTGSSVSTLFKGLSMVQVMNSLGYDAAALGNHEFDFTTDTLALRAKQSAFPFLAANVTYLDGSTPAYVQPYTIKEVNDIKVGIIGLANILTPQTANPSAVEGLVFHPYNESLRAYLPVMQQEGANFIIILGHICEEEMESLVPMANEYNIPVITGGHCHSEILELRNGVLMVETPAYLSKYIKIELEYDVKNDQATVINYGIVKNESNKRDAEIEALVSTWETKANAELGEVIGYTAEGIDRDSHLMQKIVADSWFDAFTDANLVMINRGGIRQDIEQGEITIGTILGLLPFNNEIVKMTITGKDLKDFIERQKEMHEEYIIAGYYDLSKLEDTDKLIVLTTNYLYSLEENGFSKYDPSPLSTGIVYREPSVAWVRSQRSSNDKPLESVSK